MARKTADAAIATAKHEMVWQARNHQRDLRLVNAQYTTMCCADCGARTTHRLPPGGEGTYTCPTCGALRPRDKNSAAVRIQHHTHEARARRAFARSELLRQAAQRRVIADHPTELFSHQRPR